MKLIEKEIKFDKVEVGEKFKYNGRMFVKIETVSNNNGRFFHAISCDDLSLWTFNNTIVKQSVIEITEEEASDPDILEKLNELLERESK